jgi:hypothetical protein
MRKGLWKPILVACILVAEVAVLGWVVWSAQSQPMSGVMVRSAEAGITLSDQHGVIHSIKVDSVTSPVRGWLIVQAEWNQGFRNMVLGSAAVPAGTSRNVVIDLDPTVALPGRILVSLLADKGTVGKLEYTGEMSGSARDNADVPVIAGGRPVDAEAELSPMTFTVPAGAAAIGDATRTVDATSVVVSAVTAPAQSWVSISLETTSGLIGGILGEKLVPSGTTTGVVVPLRVSPGAQNLVAALHADLGTIGQFEYSPLDVGTSKDQPYIAGGKTVSVPVRVVR